MSPLFLIANLRPLTSGFLIPAILDPLYAILAQSSPPPTSGDWQSNILRALMIVLILLNIWDKLRRKSTVHECSKCHRHLGRPDPEPRQYPAITPEEQQERREKCRWEVLAFSVNNPLLAFRAKTVRMKLLRRTNFTLAEIEAALEFQRGRGYVSASPDPNGASVYYKVTSEGILFHERNSLIYKSS